MARGMKRRFVYQRQSIQKKVDEMKKKLLEIEGIAQKDAPDLAEIDKMLGVSVFCRTTAAALVEDVRHLRDLYAKEGL